VGGGAPSGGRPHLSALAIAPPVRHADRMTPTLNVVGLIVADMPASLAFYRRLGLALPDEADAENHVEAALDGGMRLTWDTHEVVESFDPSYQHSDGAGRIALAFQCDSPADVDRVYSDVVDAGGHGHLPPWDAVWRQRYAVLHDPDGNAVDLYAPL